MLHDLAAWLLYSPRRLIAVVVVLVVARRCDCHGSTYRSTPSATRPATERPAAEAQPVVPSASEASQADHDEVEARVPVHQIRVAADSFLDLYVVPPNRQAPVLSGGLARWATPSLWRGLRLTDPAALPRGTVSELNVEAAGAYSAEVVAELSSQHGSAPVDRRLAARLASRRRPAGAGLMGRPAKVAVTAAIAGAWLPWAHQW